MKAEKELNCKLSYGKLRKSKSVDEIK